jgi:phenylacetate-CoA ligase
MSLRIPFSLATAALPVLRAPRLSPADLKLLSSKRLRKVLSSAVQVPFHQRRLREIGIETEQALLKRSAVQVLCSMPTLTKRELQEAGSAAVRRGKIDRSWYWSLSSGSTGEPLRVYYDSRAWAVLKYLVKYRARAACGLKARHRVGLLDAISPEAEGRNVLERMGRLRRISVFRPLEEIGERLIEYSPHVVYGLPSALHDIATHLGSEAASLHLRAVFTSGEFLLESDKRRLREAYACPVLDIYGSSETKEIAWECEAGSLHVNSDVVMVEILGDDGEPVQLGEEGEIVATLLVNEAMPLIRYRTGDRGSLLPGGCACGMPFPKLGVLTGREADSLQLDGGRRVSPYVLTCALEKVHSLRRYQVEQVQRARLKVSAIIDASADQDETARDIESALVRAIPGSVTVAVDFVQQLPRGPGAKFRVVVPLRG